MKTPAPGWWNDYVGIPYVLGGRDRAGIDCWGLVRMVYAEQLGIELPAFSGAYSSRTDVRIDELIAQQREGWSRAGEPLAGDLVLFRMMGREWHVGVCTQPGQFLHARDGQTAVCIERLDSVSWRHRLEGAYRYTPSALVLSACPHPLRTERIDAAVPAGSTLAEAVQWLGEVGHLPAGLPHDAVLMLDGRPVPRELWAETRPQPGARIEYRAVPRGKGALRTVLAIVVAVVAWYAAPYVMGYAAGAAGWTAASAAGFGATLAVAGTAAALNIAGSLLINAIAPIRPPAAPRVPGSPEAQRLLQGGTNRAAPYEAIPVVLGRVRITPPLGAQTYAESDGSSSYLRMLLVWGYGPLQISDLRVGQTALDSYEEVETATLSGWPGNTEDRARFNALYAQDVEQLSVGLLLESDGTDAGSPWTERVVGVGSSSVSVTLHFPQGLRGMAVEGGNAGDVTECPFTAQIQWRPVTAAGAPLADWADIATFYRGDTLLLQSAWYDLDSNATQDAVYCWTRLSLNSLNALVVRTGSLSETQTDAPSTSFLKRQADAAGISLWDYLGSRLPAVPADETLLWDVCVRGNEIVQTVDHRGWYVAGCGLSTDGLAITIASGSTVRASANAINFGAVNQPYYKRKDAFSATVSFYVTPTAATAVRVRRTNTSESEWYSGGNRQQRYHDCYVVTVTGYANRRPVNDPANARLAMTALRIRATNQINGQIDGISGTVQTICLDYDSASGTWVTRPTRNPASLLRYVWQHPANAKRVSDDGLDLPGLVDFHNYCREMGWTFDDVITSQRSLDDVARDIAAAGRASPTRRDGKRGVIIDRPRTSIAQHFTPHNSWGFRGTRTLPVMPNAFRVQFVNSEKAFQADELIVYADGYNESNATLFEGLQLPGVTTPSAVYKHARFHMAQLQLRPESYELNADIEHIVCTRGDLVRVTHDVPMWGLGSARIKRALSATQIELDELVPMDAGVQYTVRIRTAAGGSITRNVAPAGTDAYASILTLTAPLTGAEGEAGNLVMFGTLNAESVELVVHGIEPQQNLTARITLVDYAPAVYTSDTRPIPQFNSQITRPPALQIALITAQPTVSRIVSDESVMLLLAPGRYGYRIRVAYTNAPDLRGVTHVEGQIDYAGDTSLHWSNSVIEPLASGSVTFGNVVQGESYRMRLRYVGAAGRTGPWTETQVHAVVGKTTQPSAPQGVTIAPEGQLLRVRWAGCPEVDVVAYELRETDAGWGTGGHVFQGSADACTVAPGPAGVPRTWYLRGIDAVGLYSSAATPVTYTVAAPADTASVSESFADTSLTAATVTLDWPDVEPPFGLQHYRVSYGGVAKTVLASTITLPADWIGSRTFTVQTVDRLGNVSPGRAKTVTKLRPGPVTGLRAQVVDNQVELSWVLPARTTLPVSHVLIRRGAAWETAGDVGAKSGSFTQIQELVGGTYTYWVAAVDTDGWESAAPVSITVTVSSPPDLVVHGSKDSALAGATASAFVEED